MKKHLIALLFCLVSFIGNSQWDQIGSTIFGKAEGDEHGISIEIDADGTTLIIGARQNDDVADNAGQARVYEWNGTDWVQLGSDLNGTLAGNLYGTEVSINDAGNVIAIAATQFGASASTPPGFVRIFEWDGTDWLQRGADLIGNENRDKFGSSISLSADGNTVAIGAPYNSEIALFTGQTRVFQWDGISWNQLGATINGEKESDASGTSVFLNDDATKLFIGETAGSADGRIRTFNRVGSNWIEGAEINDTEGGFGVINAIDDTGTTLLAGGMPGPMSEGISKIFEFDGTVWNQKGTNIEGDAGSDFLGFQAGAMNDDGSVILLGAVTGDVGYARFLRFDGNDWVQDASDIIGEAPAVQFGRSVTMNDNCSVVAVGTRFNTGTNTGLVRVFENELLGTEIFPQNSIEFYPNPTTDFVLISSMFPIDNIRVYNELGQVVLGPNITTNHFTLDLRGHNNGTYFVKLVSKERQDVIRIVKQ